jgi:hypothetical protein
VPATLVAQAKLRATAHDGGGNTGAFTTGAFSIVDTAAGDHAGVAERRESWTEGDSRDIDWTSTDAVGVDSVVVGTRCTARTAWSVTTVFPTPATTLDGADRDHGLCARA